MFQAFGNLEANGESYQALLEVQLLALCRLYQLGRTIFDTSLKDKFPMTSLGPRWISYYSRLHFLQ